MIITRTPLRIGLFGGGSDYPTWLEKNSGCCLNVTIDKYCYISLRYLPPFFEHKTRLVYSRVEQVQNIGEIQHPSVRECLKYMNIPKGVEIHHDGDLPARSGLGTSSAFTVGLLLALHALKSEKVGKLELALKAIHVEQDLIKESVGCQDQLATSLGGLNFMEFGKGNPVITKIRMPKERSEYLQSCLMLVFTGFPHVASDIAKTYNFNKDEEISKIVLMAYTAQDILKSGDIKDIGLLLNESWQRKKSLSAQISTPYIDYVYDTAIKAGALGGKLNGAGGAGFMTLFAEPDKQPYIKEKLSGLLYVPVHFENRGAEVVFNNGEVA